MPNALPRIIRLVIKYIALLHEKAKLTLSIGPHQIHTVHTNGTVTICRGANVLDHVNLHQIKPA